MATERLTVAGIYLGKKGDRRAPVLTTFAQRGVELRPKTIADFRAGRSNGARTERIAKAAEVLLSNNAKRKNATYLAIAEIGLELRTNQIRYPNRFTSFGFTQVVASHLHIPEGLLRRVITAMRADIVFSSQDLQLFLPVAERYLSDYLDNNPATSSAQAARINTEWDRTSIEGFYRLLYLGTQSFRGVGTWTPYELEFLKDFYALQQQQGNRLTSFDRYILESTVHKRNYLGVAQYIREKTGIKANEHIITVHTNALVGFLQIN